MSTRNEGSPALAVYLDNLLLQLRLRDVPGDRIGQILAEVETHVADTGLGPVDAFGEAGEYAAKYVAVSGSAPARSWLRDLGVAMVSGMAGAAAVEEVVHLGGLAYLGAAALLVLIPMVLRGGPTLVSVPGWELCVAGLLAFSALVRHLGGDRVTDPRE